MCSTKLPRKALFLFLIFHVSLTLAFASPSQERPNIVFIYTDDQASWTIGAYGEPDAYTPNLDRLASEGARFTNAFATTPVCSPARATLFTSRYSSEVGIYDFIAAPEHKAYNPETGDIGLSHKFSTFPQALAQAGYKNALVGKWHLGDWTQDAEQRFHPTKFGFHYFMGLTGGGTKASDALLEKDGVVKKYPGLTDDVLTREGISFLERNKNNTFMLFLSLRNPHGPWLPVAPEDWEPHKNLDPEIPNPNFPELDIEKLKKMKREYYASVSGVDRNVGLILDTLDRLGLTEKTIVIFSSDHGFNMGHNGIFHKGNGIWVTKEPRPDEQNINGKFRPNLYDHSLRVPLIVRWHGNVQPGTVIEQTVSNLDFYPSILAMAGVAKPLGVAIRGRNFLPLLKGEDVAGWDNDFYSEYCMRIYCRTDMRSYRTPHWKLVRDFLNPSRDEFYNLVDDPEENRNLIGEISDPAMKNVVDELDRKIIQQMRSHNDPALKWVKQ